MMEEVGPFIYEIKNALTPEFCQMVVDRFDSDNRKYPGVTWTGKPDPKKKCTDLVISNQDGWQDADKVVFESTAQALRQMHHKSPIFMDNVTDTGYQVQKYEIGEFYGAHIDGSINGALDRTLALLWYLNDVEEGGETNFPDLKVSVKPEAGKLLIFPPYWTHLHQGLKPVSGPKYIITTFILASSGFIQ